MPSFQNDPEIRNFSLLTHFMYCSFLSQTHTKGVFRDGILKPVNLVTLYILKNYGLSQKACVMWFMSIDITILAIKMDKKKVFNYLKMIVLLSHINLTF